jgi:signal transduction histidine kinase
MEQEFDGEKRYFDLQAVTLIDQKKHQTGRLIVMKDITHHVEAEEKILETNSRLIDEIKEREKLIADLDAFSHTVAHDLKNMLGAIVTASTLIQNGIDEMPKEELLELNDLIGQSATKTMHITRELLTLASVRQQDVKLTGVNMKKVVAEALKRLDDMIQESGARFLLPNEWPLALGYESWLEEVWTNYISNALKYGGTPPVIQLGAEPLPSGLVKFWIKDNGKGLSEEQIVLLFNKFTRLETLRAEGHGLGLSIVKRIIEKLNGHVGVESRNIPGEGSTFYFLLPTTDQPSGEIKSM